MKDIAEFLALPAFLLVSAWGALKIVVDVFDRLNAIRNFALGIGDDAAAVDISTRRKIFLSDWLPLAFGLGLALLIFVAVFAFIPTLFPKVKASKEPSWELIGALGQPAFWGFSHIEIAAFAYAMLGAFALLAHVVGAACDYRLVSRRFKAHQRSGRS